MLITAIRRAGLWSLLAMSFLPLWPKSHDLQETTHPVEYYMHKLSWKDTEGTAVRHQEWNLVMGSGIHWWEKYYRQLLSWEKLPIDEKDDFAASSFDTRVQSCFFTQVRSVTWDKAALQSCGISVPPAAKQGITTTLCLLCLNSKLCRQDRVLYYTYEQHLA